jgi:preprotein translocase subunit SecD
MKRRRLLATLGTSATLAIAGCNGLVSEDDSPAEEPADGSSGTGSDDGDAAVDTDEADLYGEFVAWTVEAVDISGDSTELAADIAAALDLDERAVRVDAEDGTVVILDGDVTETAAVDALAAAGIEATTEQVRQGVTAEIRGAAAGTIGEWFERGGIDGSVGAGETPDGDPALRFSVPEGERDSVRDLLETGGRVRIVAGYPAGGDDPRMETVLRGEDFAEVGEASEANGAPYLPVTLTGDAADRFRRRLVETGFTGEGVGRCEFDPASDDPAPDEYCLYTVVGGDIVHGAAMSRGLADVFESGEFTGEFRLTVASFDQARQLETQLRAGTVPAAIRLIEPGD